jgi:GNAT superfamily N-acetyltransferase
MTTIRPPRRDELELLRSIERDAGQAFAALGMTRMGEALRVDELEALRSAGRAWVTVDDDDTPIAYLLSAVLDNCAHIEQVSVAPSHARRGIGAALIEHLATIAQREERAALTLTTFRDVPWNAPYYQRLGFTIVEAPDQDPDLAVVVARETRSIPGRAPRVAMRRPLAL